MKYLVLNALFFITFKISHQDKAGGELLNRYFKTHADVRTKCLEETHADKNLEAIFEDVAEIQDDLRCFTKCFLIESGAINEAGDPIPENIIRNLQLTDVSLGTDLVKQCSGYDRVDLCKGAKQLIDCGLTYLESRLKLN